jgi:hypothetical protein
LELYLQGKPPEEIAKRLDIDIKEIYRLREKINYHAINVFAIKAEPQLVSQWLKVTLEEHNLGLTPTQWESFYGDLEPKSRQILDGLKAGESIETIAKQIGLKTNQVMAEWRGVYQKAQEIRIQ